MKVIVTGGAGFIGSHIVDTLLAKGHEPFVIDNLCSGEKKNLPPSVPVFEADIVDGARISAIFDEVKPDWVCHQAAQMSVSRSMREPLFDAENNVMGLLNVFDNAARVGVKRIVFASSGGVLYGEMTTPAPEDSPKKPVSPYGISKWIGEQYLEFYARERGLQGVALRYSNVYGPRQNPHGEAGVVAIFCKAMLAGKAATVNGDGKYVRDYVHGRDVALANVAALETTMSASFTPINIGTGVGADVNEIASQLYRATQDYLKRRQSSVIVPECRHGESRAGDLRSNLVSPSRAALLLNWKPTIGLKEGIEQTVAWFAENQGL
ncbi:NAD-dependent epimerase/dehydratase family protein [Schlesneria paludicola]|uniref:NAD-dependent epimerase/dehydratase family protein n=1 Tax=Schlesneria paludicola TaxID=360056 RepID=UPI00029B214C|nr:NAD-dependent epimerase/dehydratase family protein [Schlesneria paludicola]